MPKLHIFVNNPGYYNLNKQKYVQPNRILFYIMMQIESNHKIDRPDDLLLEGGYEWWYFDAIDLDKGYKAVIIFYAANPFSIHYIKKLVENEQVLSPTDVPAVSISIYEGSKTIYYSFTEYGKEDFSFTENPYQIRIGNNQIFKSISDEKLVYRVQIAEDLPSGDRIEAELNFSSSKLQRGFNRPSHTKNSIQKDNTQPSNNANANTHIWNLIQPSAMVSGQINLYRPANDSVSITFNGRGYHDQNTGMEPMKDSFSDWYWGRFHFDDFTLVYYAMNHITTHKNANGSKKNNEKNYNAWLFDRQLDVIKSTDSIALSSMVPNVFGLVTNRLLHLKSGDWEATIQQSTPVDNGPFYQRFVANAIIHLPERNKILASTGFTEYIKPSRIYNRLFWPLVKMRLRRYHEQPHWVQKSPMLYRWTW